MHILGLNAFHADSAAAIFADGELLAATEEERFTRVKHWAGFPAEAIAFCLREAGIGLGEVDRVCIGRDPRAKFAARLRYLCAHPAQLVGGIARAREQARVMNIGRLLAEADRAVSREVAHAKVRHVEHHRAHLASAFFASPFPEAAIASVDGSGDFTTAMIAVGWGNRIQVLGSVDFPASLGLFYTAFTQFLGFRNYGDEYKIMGLGPYGAPTHLAKVRRIIRLNADGLYDWDKRYFVGPGKAGFRYEAGVPVVGNLYSDRFIREFGPPRRSGEPITAYHKDLAASVQAVLEEVLFGMLRGLRQRTGMKNVCIAGGVAQNSVANGKVAEATGFRGVYVPSAGHDAGIALGSAMYHYHHELAHPRSAPLRSAYTGVRFSNEEIEAFLRDRGVAYRRLADDALYETVVRKLTQPGVVGWFCGRAEFGPRALGARSILADPRNPGAKELLNTRIKRRESFRPFAPSILREHVGEYFTRVEEVPFMEKVLPVRPERRALIPAVTHVDGSGRLQTVDREVAPRYHALIERFRQETGVPLLLNTSFNENEPIVNTPGEALDCFQRTAMDMLVMENCVVER